MTPKEFYELLAYKDTKPAIELPLPIKLGTQDKYAARLLLWLQREMPDNATQGDMEDVLDSAKWWAMFWGAAHAARKLDKEDTQ